MKILSRSDFYSRYVVAFYLRSSPTKWDRVVQREYFRRATVARRGIHSESPPAKAKTPHHVKRHVSHKNSAS